MCKFKRFFEKELPSKHPELFEGAIVFGSINDVVFVESKGNKYAIKLNQNYTDSHTITSAYCRSVVGKQLWAHQIVHKDVPVLSVFPEIIGTGKLESGEEFSYFCMEWSSDQNPEVGLHGMYFSMEKCTKYFYPEYKDEGLDFLENVGRIAAQINQISTDSFGGGPKNWVDSFILEDSRFEYGDWGDFVRSYITRIDFWSDPQKWYH